MYEVQWRNRLKEKSSEACKSIIKRFFVHKIVSPMCNQCDYNFLCRQFEEAHEGREFVKSSTNVLLGLGSKLAFCSFTEVS